MKRILVTGALGQIGSELTPALRERYGAEGVLATDVRMRNPSGREPEGPFEYLDCTYSHQVQEIIRKFDVGAIYHLASLLSAVAEERPHIAWEVNMRGDCWSYGRMATFTVRVLVLFRSKSFSNPTRFLILLLGS